MSVVATATERDLVDRLLSVGPRIGRLIAGVARDAGTLSPERAKVLGQLAEGPLRSGEVAERCLLTRSAITEVVEGLVRDELLRRDEDLSDRRAVVLALTPAGRRELHRFRERLAVALGELFARLDGRERDRLRAALSDLDRVLSEGRDAR